MADTSLPMQSTQPLMPGRTDWSAIWGGVFAFAGIWGVFESLAVAIFGMPVTMSGMGVGMAIWTIVLTIIAMYVAGIETARLSGVVTRRDGVAHGMMMFGLSIVSAIVLTVLTAVVLNNGMGATAAGHITWTAGMGWAGFLSLFLGWLAAIGGASSGVQHKTVESRQPVPVRPAA